MRCHTKHSSLFLFFFWRAKVTVSHSISGEIIDFVMWFFPSFSLKKKNEKKVKVWFQNRRMKHKRQTLSKTDEEDNKDSLKGDDDSQPCSKFSFYDIVFCNLWFRNWWPNLLELYFIGGFCFYSSFFIHQIKTIFWQITKKKQQKQKTRLFRRCSNSRFKLEEIMSRMRIAIAWYSRFHIEFKRSQQQYTKCNK